MRSSEHRCKYMLFLFLFFSGSFCGFLKLAAKNVFPPSVEREESVVCCLALLGYYMRAMTGLK